MSEVPVHKRVDISLGERSYPILIGSGLVADGSLVDAHVRARSALIVTNETIAPLYLATLERALGSRRVAHVILPDGEQHKTLQSLSRIFDALIEERMNRDSAVLALGGGVEIGRASCRERVWLSGGAAADNAAQSEAI